MSEKRSRKKHREQPAKQAQATAVLPESNNALTTQQAAVVLAVGLAFGVGVIYEWGPLNGFPNLTKWGWPWQDLGTLQIGLALLAPFLLIAGVLLIVNRSTSRSGRDPAGSTGGCSVLPPTIQRAGRSARF